MANQMTINIIIERCKNQTIWADLPETSHTSGICCSQNKYLLRFSSGILEQHSPLTIDAVMISSSFSAPASCNIPLQCGEVMCKNCITHGSFACVYLILTPKLVTPASTILQRQIHNVSWRCEAVGGVIQ